MQRLIVFSLFMVIGVAATTHAGLAVTLQSGSSLTAGTTALFDVSVVNTSTSPWSFSTVGPPLTSIAPDLLYNLSSNTTPVNYTALTTGVPLPNPSNGWSLISGSGSPNYFIHAAGNVDLEAGLSHAIGELSVDIPAGYTGEFTFDLANDVVIVGSGFVEVTGDTMPPNSGTAPNAHSFSIASVPEPNAFLLMSLVGFGLAGINFYRRKTAA